MAWEEILLSGVVAAGLGAVIGILSNKLAYTWQYDHNKQSMIDEKIAEWKLDAYRKFLQYAYKDTVRNHILLNMLSKKDIADTELTTIKNILQGMCEDIIKNNDFLLEFYAFSSQNVVSEIENYLAESGIIMGMAVCLMQDISTPNGDKNKLDLDENEIQKIISTTKVLSLQISRISDEIRKDLGVESVDFTNLMKKAHSGNSNL
jgi:hypothetical protein